LSSLPRRLLPLLVFVVVLLAVLFVVFVNPAAVAVAVAERVRLLTENFGANKSRATGDCDRG